MEALDIAALVYLNDFCLHLIYVNLISVSSRKPCKWYIAAFIFSSLYLAASKFLFHVHNRLKLVLPMNI